MFTMNEKEINIENYWHYLKFSLCVIVSSVRRPSIWQNYVVRWVHPLVRSVFALPLVVISLFRDSDFEDLATGLLLSLGPMCGNLFWPKLDNRVTIYYSSKVNWKHSCSSSPEPFCGSISNEGHYKYSLLLLLLPLLLLLQCRRMIPASVHSVRGQRAPSVYCRSPLLLKNQSERSVNAAMMPGERGVSAQWTQNARRPHSVWTLSERRANTGQARSRHSLLDSECRLNADQTRVERRPDTHWPGSADFPLRREPSLIASGNQSTTEYITVVFLFQIKSSVIYTYKLLLILYTNVIEKRNYSVWIILTAFNLTALPLIICLICL